MSAAGVSLYANSVGIGLMTYRSKRVQWPRIPTTCRRPRPEAWPFGAARSCVLLGGVAWQVSDPDQHALVPRCV